MSNVKNNIRYQTIYQILTTAIPLITAPYLSRTLGATQQGIYSYTNSIVSYFSLFAMLGIVNHGTRSIANCSKDPAQRSRQYWSIFSIQLFTATLATVFYIIYLLILCKANIMVASLQIMTIIACFFDVNWFFFGIEQFKTTVSINMVVKVLVVLGIFLFVKTPEDTWIYTGLMSGSLLIGNAALAFMIPKYISFSKISTQEVFNELKPILILFVPVFAMTIYHVMDKTMLGALSDYRNSGYYYNADKIINIPIGIISGISTVLFPRMVQIQKNSTKDGFNEVFSKCFEGISLISIAFAFGIAAIATEFVPWFFGNEYKASIILVQALAPVMIIKSLSTVIRYQYLIPLKKDNIFIASVFAGAAINLAANLLLIPRFGALGAVIGTLLAELLALIVQLFFITSKVALSLIFNNFIQYLFIGIIMCLIVRFVASIVSTYLLVECMLEIFVGALIYCVLCLVFHHYKKEKTVLHEIIKSLNSK